MICNKRRAEGKEKSNSKYNRKTALEAQIPNSNVVLKKEVIIYNYSISVFIWFNNSWIQAYVEVSSYICLSLENSCLNTIEWKNTTLATSIVALQIWSLIL